MRSLTLWRLSKQKLSSNKGRISKWFILTEVVSIMVDMMRRDATLDHLRSTFKNVASMLSIRCLVLLGRIGFIGYYVGSRSSSFYCPSHTTIVIESD